MAREPDFEWGDAKDRANRAKHGVSFAVAQIAFFDPRRVIAEDVEHSGAEPRYFCFGMVSGGPSRETYPNFRRGLLAESQKHL
jgi:uncharacterized DUF497 family protein